LTEGVSSALMRAYAPHHEPLGAKAVKAFTRSIGARFIARGLARPEAARSNRGMFVNARTKPRSADWRFRHRCDILNHYES